MRPLRLRRAATAWQRLRGLLGGPPLARGEALWLDPCRAVHTAGMRYAIDVAFVDGRGRVVRVVRGLRPWRCAWCLRARSAVELRAGQAGAAHGGVARIEAALHGSGRFGWPALPLAPARPAACRPSRPAAPAQRAGGGRKPAAPGPNTVT